MDPNSLFTADRKPQSDSARTEGPLQELGRWLPEPSYFRSRLRRLTAHPLFWKASALVVAGLVVWTFAPGALAWAQEKTARVAEAGSTALIETTDAVLPAQRAEFQAVRNYSAVVLDSSDPAAIAYLPESVRRSSYRVDIVADLNGTPVRWAVGPAGKDDYVVFSTRKTRQGYVLERCTVEAGEPVPESEQTVEIETDAVSLERNTLSIVVRPGSVTTLLNGYGVDFHRDVLFLEAGVGFVGSEDETPPVQEIIVRGNEDEWGRFIAAARQAIHGWLS